MAARIYDKGASERFQPEIKQESPSISHTVLLSLDGIDYLDPTPHDTPPRQRSPAQQDNRFSRPRITVNTNQQEEYYQQHEQLRRDTVHHSTRMPVTAESVDEEDIFMHNIEHPSDQMDLDTSDVPLRIDLQPTPTFALEDLSLLFPGLGPDEDIYENVTTHPSPPHNTSRPRSRLDTLIEIDDSSEESEESSSEESTSSSEESTSSSEESTSSSEDCDTVHPISGEGAWSMPPPDFFIPRSHTHRPSPSDDIGPFSHPITHARNYASSASKHTKEVESLGRANLISRRSFALRGRTYDTAPKAGAENRSLPRPSQQPNKENPPTEPILPGRQYHIIKDMPIVLPRPPRAEARARRLLLPSHQSRPIAWVSMRGDTQWVDPTWK